MNECKKYIVVFTRKKMKIVSDVLVVDNHPLMGFRKRRKLRKKMVTKKETWVRRANSMEEVVSLVRNIYRKYKIPQKGYFPVKVYKYIDTVDSPDNLSLLKLQGQLNKEG